MFGKKKATAAEVKKKETATPAPTPQEPAKPLTLKQEQELKRKAYQEKVEADRLRILEQKRLQQQQEVERLEALKRKHRITMITFTIGLFVLLTALICLFPTTEMIIFSTLLMFSFFFLGIAFQRIVMQLLVIAMACVLITGAFYMIINSF